MSHLNLSETLARLEAEHKAQPARTIVEHFADDPRRFADFHVTFDDLLFDFSKHRISRKGLADLIALAQVAGLAEKRAALFSGALVNTSEHRAALHMALRDFSGRALLVEGQDIMPDIAKVRARVAAFASAVRHGTARGATGAQFTDVINIGIGGSDLGPAMAVKALGPYGAAHLRCHFVSNVDGADIADTLAQLEPAKTLIIVASKTFTTQETMTNAHSARSWLVAALGEAAVAQHFCAVSTRLDKVAEFGIAPDRVFGFWDWVGGRYSLWSSIGLAIVMAIGPEHFEAMLRGASEIDQHFIAAPFERNIPVLMGLLGVHYRNVERFPTHAVIPYDQRLSRFPAYLQQLEMESNGKRVTKAGLPVTTPTAPVIWGEPGTNGQHAFFQMLHQGTQIVPVDFLIAAEPTAADSHHHDLLVANCLAQGEAFMRGRTLSEVEALMVGESKEAIAALAPHKVFVGNRPSSTFLYRALTPRTLGRLIALYEHKVFVQSVIWDINPFDQWGVELGKELASRLAPIAANPDASLASLDASTAGLIAHRRLLQGSKA